MPLCSVERIFVEHDDFKKILQVDLDTAPLTTIPRTVNNLMKILRNKGTSGSTLDPDDVVDVDQSSSEDEEMDKGDFIDMAKDFPVSMPLNRNGQPMKHTNSPGKNFLSVCSGTMHALHLTIFLASTLMVALCVFAGHRSQGHCQHEGCHPPHQKVVLGAAP